jgi:hypothetical protein
MLVADGARAELDDHSRKQFAPTHTTTPVSRRFISPERAANL